MSRSLQACRRKRRARGFTLVEMMIALTLVAAIITGLMMAMRSGLTAYERVNARLEENRRVMGLDQALHRQFGGMMPVTGNCGASAGPKVSAFNGDAASLRFVSSFSLDQGARGYPRVVEYVAAPDPHGGFRLMMNERLYSGPASVAPQCVSNIFPPVQVTAAFRGNGREAGVLPLRLPRAGSRFSHGRRLDSGAGSVSICREPCAWR